MMSRSILVVLAVFLSGLLWAPAIGHSAPPPAAESAAVSPFAKFEPDRAETVRIPDASLRLAAADPDRGGPRKAEKRDAPSGEPAPAPGRDAVLERPSPISGLIELAILMAAGLGVGLAALALGRTGGAVTLAVLGGGVIGSSVYAFMMGAPVSHPSSSLAAAFLIFCASALAINLFGRAGLAALRRLVDRRQGQVAGDAAE